MFNRHVHPYLGFFCSACGSQQLTDDKSESRSESHLCIPLTLFSIPILYVYSVVQGVLNMYSPVGMSPGKS